MALGQIISQFRRKNTGGTYDTFYLGPEQHYSRALPTSNNNNLEEQLLMGVDKIVRIWHDDAENVDRKVIEFRRESDTTDYYILDITISGDKIIYVEDEIAYFTPGANMVVNTDILAQTIYDAKMYYEPTQEMFVAQLSQASENRTLYYVQSDGTRLKISTKIITREVDENNVVTIKEEITNYL